MTKAVALSKSRESRTLHRILQKWAELTPEAIAIAAPGRAPLTYRRLFAHVETVIESLNAAGVGPNDRVVVALPDGPETAVAFLAVAAAASCVPLNPAYRAGELTSYMAHLGAKALIAPAETDSHARTVARSLGIPVLELSTLPHAEAGLFKLSGAANARAARSGFAAPDDVALMLYTSGTTSNPKLVPLTQANLCASARNIRAALELTQADRCLNVMPLFHIHGLVGAVLSSLAAGASVICPPGFNAPKIFEWLEEFRPTWYTAVPTIHQSILVRAAANREIIARSELRFIRSCSAPLPARLASELETTFAVPVIDSYGMTEACHQIASTPPGRRKPGSVGVAAGPEIAIIDETGGRLPAEADGEIAIRGANVMSGYDGAPEIHRQTFTGDWFRTGDLGHIDGEGYLFITGRLKEIINRAGEKISPAEVEEALLAHSAVKEAVVFAMPHPELGEEIAAAAVLRANVFATGKEIQEFAAKRLADFKVPSRVVFVAAIPTGATGKVERLKLAEQLALLPESIDVMADYVSPRTPLENQLADLWSEVLGVARVGIHDNFFALGGDSILAAQLLSRIRAKLNAEISFVSFFDAPTIAGIAALLQSAPRPAAALDGIARSQDGDAPPLSYAQERMWFLDQLDPGNPAYNRPTGYRLHGPLDAAVLERCLGEIVERHEVLRTTFSSRDGLPFQVVSRDPSLSFEIVDLKELPGARRRMESERIAAAEAKRPFDLAKGPLLRATLIALHETEHILLLVTHHIVFDGWSEAIFLRELTTLYEAFARGEPSPLPALPTQYVDYTVWQRRRLHGRIFEDQLSYWKRQLSGAAVLDLPADRLRPAVQTFRGAKKFAAVPKNLVEELKALSRREGATLFMTLLAAFQTLLHRYTGQDDIVVGSPIAGRTLPELEGLIGMFINSLILRGDLSGNPKFTELMARTRKTALDAYERQDLPFEKLVKELRPERDPSRTPLFQVMFVFENTPHAELDFPGLTASRFEVDGGTAKLDLSVSVEETAGSLNAIFEYNTDLFEHDTMSRMLGHFETLLQSIAADPERRLSELRLLTEAERRRLLVEWNDTKRDYPQDRCVHELFEQQAERSPDAPAFVCEDKRLIYGELNRRANRLARYLKKLGAEPEARIGLYMERSIDAVVGILAILKAGGAYLPLDPAYPRERLEFMARDAGMSLLVTQKLLAKLPARGTQIVCLDTDGAAIARESEDNLVSGATPASPAYVIYTSGSTGRPKGVLGLHRGAVNRFAWMWKAYPFAPEEVCCQKTSLNFVDSVWELFGPLLRGIPTVIVPDEPLKDTRRLVQILSERRVTRIVLVPSLLRAILESDGNVERLSALKICVSSGEALSAETARRFRELLPHAVLLNLYGSSEISADVTWYDCGRIDGEFANVPVGRPIANTQIYILDRYLQPVPAGVTGELHVGGAGLARGYLNRPELTAEKFISNPFVDDPAARLFKTGDLARYLPDGDIELLGRSDHQVKIRGVRVEPGEIETVLAQNPKVRQAVVVGREDERAGNRLVAYVVPAQDTAPASTELRDFLREKLPEPMIPSQFVFLDVLPLNPNGKIDRRALPAPDWGRPELQNPFVAPRSSIEETLAGIWAQVLGLERVGAHDNFFDLGGHSLLATQVISRLREVYRIEISLRNFFETPTVAGIADLIQRAKDGGAENPMPRIARVSRQKFGGARDNTINRDSERDLIWVDSNGPEKEYPAQKCIHELFEEQAERTPDSTAAVFENRQLTYRELNRRANQLAHYLRKSGVGPETRVGIYLERSLEMIVAILGVLKAGGAYVPLDSAYPKKRLAFMLAETQPTLVIADRPPADDFPEFQGQVLCLDRDESKYAGEEEKNPEPAAGPDNLAYIMYTSGSTGKPKGVLIRHRGIVNYFFYLRETYNLNGADTVLQLPPISFDASVRDLLGPLTAGARVVLVNDFDARAPSALLSEIRKRRVTCLLSVVPTMLNALLEAARDRPRVDTMRLILVSGEALSMSSCLKTKEVFGRDVWIVNQYGPTETTLTCSYHRVVDDDSDRDIAPLGKPIPTARIYILDRDLQIVPTGVAGELHIGGAGLARGYLNSPALTAEKFIPNPFSDEPGARLYKTGDLARYLPDGNIEFLGRLDTQVKIRGFRVEPGEIEAALAKHPAVRAAAVAAREEASTGRRLVAYVVPTGTQVPAAELRDFLKSRLPDYMVPSAFVALAALPLTPNGKIDRLALPAPDRSRPFDFAQDRPELKNTFVAPRNALETTLAAIWAQVLGLKQVGVHDNFFDLGGHSLLATQVISRVREARRVEVNLRTFFERPTVAGIAEVIERAKDSDAESATPKISRVSRQSQP